MLNSNQEFFDLLKDSDQLKKKSKYLSRENPKKYKKLLEFSVRAETNLHLRQKDNYIDFIEMFVNNKMDAENFSFCFIAKYDSINQTFRKMEEDFEKNFDELSNLLRENKKINEQIGRSLMFMYDHCDDYNIDLSLSLIDEETLKNHAQLLLSELKRA